MNDIVSKVLNLPDYEATGRNVPKRTMLELAYKPRRTAVMAMAEEAGWQTIPGLEVLASQGWYQVSTHA